MQKNRITQTWEHPGQEGEHRAWFRSAALAGLPERVRADLKKNPDFAVANSTKWERHVIHGLQLEQDEGNDPKETPRQGLEPWTIRLKV